MAIEAAAEAARRYMETRDEQQRVVELELQQARYEAALAERRYAACDPDNRLIAAQLEKSWETALRRVEACEARLDAMRSRDPPVVPPDFTGLADDLNAAWNAPGVTMRTRQRLLRALVTDIIADVDGARGCPDDPLARRSALTAARPKAAIRRAWLPHARRGARGDA